MRIAFVTREYPPETAWGGIATHYEALAQGLAGLGCEVEVFAQGLSQVSSAPVGSVLVHRFLPRQDLIGRRRGGEFGGGRERLDGNGLPRGLGRIGVFALSLAREARLAFERRHGERPFDLVECHEHLGIGALLERKYGSSLSLVIRYHMAYDSLVRRGLTNWPSSRLVARLERQSIHLAHARIAPSRFIAELADQDFAGPTEELIPNLSPSSMRPDAPPIETRPHRIAFVGRMMPKLKNPDLAARAFAILAHEFPEWQIDFAGLDIPLTRKETMWDRCRTVLAEFPGRFTYHGVLSAEDLSALYARSRILVVPSSVEAFGLVAREAMAHGCIPVVSSQTALTEVVGDTGIVFENGSLPDLVTRLRELMSSEAEQIRLSTGSVERVRREFDPDGIVARNLAFFRRCVERRTDQG